MANIKITQLENLSSTDVAAEDVFVIDDVSGLITRKITVANVSAYLSTINGNARAVSESLLIYAYYSDPFESITRCLRRRPTR